MRNVYIIIEERYENRDKNISWNREVKEAYSSKQKAIEELKNFADFCNKDSETTNVELTVNENKNGYFAAWLKWTDDTGTGHIQYIKQKTVW